MFLVSLRAGLSLTLVALLLAAACASTARPTVRSDSHLYVVDSAANAVLRYSIRNGLPIPNYAGAFTVDADGYIYAVVGSNHEQIEVAAPHVSAIHFMSLPDPAYPNLQTGPGGELFSLSNLFGVYVFRHPHSEMVPDTLLRIIVRYIPQVIFDRWQDGDFAMLDRLDRTHDRLYQTRDCFLQGASPGPIFGLAENAPYVYLSCQFPYAVVYVYDTRTARNEKLKPVETLRTPLQYPAQISVGP